MPGCPAGWLVGQAAMRLLFIRHAESEENYFMESIATRYPDGLPKGFDFFGESAHPAGPPPHHPTRPPQLSAWWP